jgi:hypothetical protein
MKTIHLTGIAFCALFVSCATKPIAVTHSQDLHSLLGQNVTITGTAFHSCPGAVVIDNDCQVLIENMKYWPTNCDHQRVQVTGLLGQQHRPDLYVIHEAKWTLSP